MRKSRSPSPAVIESSHPDDLRAHGITPGGFVTDHDGTKWYAKFHTVPEGAYSEHVANQIYRRTGNHAPLSVVTTAPDPDAAGSTSRTQTRPVYFSKFVHPEFTTTTQYRRDADIPTSSQTRGDIQGYMRRISQARVWEQVHPAASHKFVQGTATDVLLNTYDQHGENVGFIPIRTPTASGGQIRWNEPTEGKPSLLPVRLDNGASLLNRGPGHNIRQYIPEPVAQATYERVRGALRPEDQQRLGYDARDVMNSPGVMVPGVQRINALYQRHGGWKPLVQRLTPGLDRGTQNRLTDVLHERHAGLIRHVQDLLPVQRHSTVRRR